MITLNCYQTVKTKGLNMFKMGGFYLTLKGQLVKIFNSFNFADGYTITAAVYKVGSGWTAVRYTQDGQCNLSNENNQIINFESFVKYKTYLNFTVWCDRATGKWCGKAIDPFGQMVVQLIDIEHENRAMDLIHMGCEEKLLNWMREAGYDEEIKEVVDA